MNQKPFNLTVSDLTQTRSSGSHARWPRDPDTTARLDRIRQVDPYAQSKFKDRYSVLRLVLHGMAFLGLASLFLISLIIIAEAVRHKL